MSTKCHIVVFSEVIYEMINLVNPEIGKRRRAKL